MITPSSNFTADELRFIQKEGEDYIKYVNEKILDAAQRGENQVRFDIIKDQRYWKAPDALRAYFESRGFETLWGGQTDWGLKW